MTLELDSAYRAHWTRWAASMYPDPAVAEVAAGTALEAIEHGSIPNAAAVAGHRAAIEAGGEYRCRPNRVVKAIVVCVLVMLLFVPATLSGLSVNPAPAGYAFLAFFTAVPLLSIGGLVMVARNSCFFANKATVGRRSFTGRVAGAMGRSDLVKVALRPGMRGNMITLTEGEVDESIVRIAGRRRDLPETSLFWWTDDRIREFAAVAKL